MAALVENINLLRPKANLITAPVKWILTGTMIKLAFNRLLFSRIVMFVCSGKPDLCYRILKNLCHAQRFDMVLLFLSESDKGGELEKQLTRFSFGERGWYTECVQ